MSGQQNAALIRLPRLDDPKDLPSTEQLLGFAPDHSLDFNLPKSNCWGQKYNLRGTLLRCYGWLMTVLTVNILTLLHIIPRFRSNYRCPKSFRLPVRFKNSA